MGANRKNRRLFWRQTGMKQLAFLICIFLVLSAGFAVSVQVTRSFGQATVNSSLTVTLFITPATELSNFNLVDFLPPDWSISSWNVTGIDKAAISTDEQQRPYQGKNRHAYSWEFKKPFSTPITLTYTTTPPATGSFEFIALWLYPSGFDQATATLNVVSSAIEPLPETKSLPSSEETGSPVSPPPPSISPILPFAALVLIAVAWLALRKRS